MDRTLNLTPQHKAVRRAWAEKHVVIAWEGVVFSDEEKFHLDGPDGFKFYWRDMRKPPKRYVNRQAGGSSVMVWGCFSSKGEIAFLVDKQKSSDYIYTLSEYLLPFAYLHYGTDFLFLQDNASIHTSHETRAFMEEYDIALLDWPARSPNLNPIENLWSILARKVYDDGKHQFETVDELEDAIRVAWDEIGQTTLSNLVASMPSRCMEVHDQRGDKIPY